MYEGLTLNQKRLLVRFLQEDGERVGYLCSELDEIILMKEADVGFSQSVTISDRAGGSGVDLSRHNIPIYAKSANTHNQGCEALKFVSDVIVSEPDVSGTGGFNAIIDALLCSKSIYFNIYRMLKYMIISQIARLCLVFTSIFVGFSSLIPTQILFLGLITDFAAVIIIAFQKPEPILLKRNDDIVVKINKPFIKNPETAFFGIFLAASTAFATVILQNHGLLNSDATSSFCFISFLIAEISLLNECKQENSIFNKNIRINGAYVAMLTVTLTFIVLCVTLPEFAALFGIVRLGKYALISSIAPAFGLTVLYEIFKSITGYGVDRKKRNENKNKSSKKTTRVNSKRTSHKKYGEIFDKKSNNDWITEDVDVSDSDDDDDQNVKPIN